MTGTIIGFIKVFKEEPHREEFLDGCLFMGRLGSYKKSEDAEENNRADKFEAPNSWFQSNLVSVEINNHVIEGIAGPVVIQNNEHDYLNIYCLYSITAKQHLYKDKQIDNLYSEIAVDKSIFKLGGDPVVITDIRKFITLAAEEIHKHGTQIKFGSVKYFDPESFHGTIPEDEQAFWKRKNYSHQKEFRLSMFRDFGSKPYKVPIPSLRDIAFPCSIDEIENTIKRKLLCVVA